MGEMINTYRVLVGHSEGNGPLEEPRCIWEDNIKKGLGEMDGRVCALSFVSG
jgi:hypothetical protein